MRFTPPWTGDSGASGWRLWGVSTRGAELCQGSLGSGALPVFGLEGGVIFLGAFLSMTPNGLAASGSLSISLSLSLPPPPSSCVPAFAVERRGDFAGDGERLPCCQLDAACCRSSPSGEKMLVSLDTGERSGRVESSQAAFLPLPAARELA